MSQQRLLLFFSYLGTNYSGAQRLLARESKGADLGSVQGIIEWGLNKVLRTNDSVLLLSSRTDTGVHAIQSTAQFDNRGTRINPTFLCQGLNLYLEKNQTDIRIKRILEVPTDFHCRHVLSRSYRYRIALFKSNDIDSCINSTRLTSLLPITELYRCEPVLPPLNTAAIFEASKLFLGTWNFSSFGSPTKSDKEQKEEEDYIKTILRISFGRSSNEEIADVFNNEMQKKFEFFDFHVDGSGFIRRQVRKIVGALLGIGRGIITEKDIKFMLENPSPTHWNSKVQVASPFGLFLKSINYRDIPIVRL